MEVWLPEHLDWDSDVNSRTESEGLSSSDSREHNVESLALSIFGQNWSGEKISLFLENWELARVALSCNVALDMFVPGNARGLVAGLPLPEKPTVTGLRTPFSHRGRAVQLKERDVVRENKEKGV